MANVKIPAGATVEKSWTGTYAGDTLYVTLYKGKASDGYKSEFNRRDTRWISWRRVTGTGKLVHTQATRYGGQRFARGLTDYAESVAQIVAAGAQKIESVKS